MQSFRLQVNPLRRMLDQLKAVRDPITATPKTTGVGIELYNRGNSKRGIGMPRRPSMSNRADSQQLLQCA
jgi:hypothetical protein